MNVKDIMTKGVEFIDGNKTVADAMKTMLSRHITSLMVERESKYDSYGVVTRKDIVNKVIAEGKNPRRVKVKEVASKPIISVHPNLNINDLAKLMARLDLRRFPVDDGRKLVGLVSNSDVIRAKTLALKKAR